MGFPEFFEKTICSIHLIRGIYPYGASLLIPIDFRLDWAIFGPLGIKKLSEMGQIWGFRNFL